MKNSIFEIFRISGEGLRYQRMRLESIARNIANANVTRSEDGKPYKRELIIASARETKSFEDELSEAIFSRIMPKTENEASTMTIKKIVDDSDFRMVYEPSHPDADEKGYVLYPNVNIVTEMVDMISAQRAFESNVSVIEAAKNVARDSLDI